MDEIEKLERDIISTKNNLVEGRSSLSTVLTQTRIFCQKLNVDDEWITNELEGYEFKNLKEAKEKIPKYRLVSYEFLDMYNRPIIIQYPPHGEFIQNLVRGPLTMPITNFQGIHDGYVATIHSGQPIELFHIFVEKGWLKEVFGPTEVAGISARVNNSQLLAIYDNVKNRTIELLSELEDEVKKVKLR